MTDSHPSDEKDKIDDMDDKDIENLLRNAGPRRTPPGEMRDRIYANTLETWEGLPAKRSYLNHRWVAMAASILLAGVMLTTWLTPGEVVTPLGQFTGHAGELKINGEPTIEATTVHVGDTIDTSNSGFARLAIEHAHISLDGGSTVRFEQSNRVHLFGGRIYIDVYSSNPGAITVATESVEISDIGTQFEVSRTNSDVQVSVREGRVDITLAGGSTHMARAHEGTGEVVRLTGQGEVSRSMIKTTDTHWDWITKTRTIPEMAGKPVFDYLTWIARDRGLTLKWQGDAVKMTAQTDSMLGAGSAENESLENALKTTQFTRIDGAPHELIIDFRR